MKGFTRCTCSENRKTSEWSDTSASDLMNRMANSENCSMEPDTSQSITTRFRRLWRLRYLSRHSAPPVAFGALSDSMLPAELRETVAGLVEQKMQTPEFGTGTRVPLLHEYLERSLNELEQEAVQLPAAPEKDWALLDRLFLEAVRAEG